MHNLQPGDMAVITTQVGTVTPGAVVKILEEWPKGTIVKSPEGRKGMVILDSFRFGHESLLEVGLTGHAPVECFFPLKRDFAPERQKSQELPA